jgi:hypothetical protein
MTLHPPRLVAVVVLLLAGAAGCDAAGSDEQAGPDGWQEQAAAIEGIVDYRADRPELVEPSHSEQPVAYEVLPPVGGAHHPAWLNCNGEVYSQPVVNEHAVHSLEHGAVWITYRPDLPADQVSALAGRVSGTEKMFMSPYPDLDAPISLQAWGYQLKVDDAGDERIDEFIRALRVNASIEGPTVPCDGGIPNSAAQ